MSSSRSHGRITELHVPDLAGPRPRSGPHRAGINGTAGSAGTGPRSHK
ncbi:hypothetical protein GFS60_07949 (plasmid) [Rhodococcus sp. WAY2]|nr:hypothetical protein GFS60_07949 [Rhodococcus sp. WAY2]